MSFMTLKNGCAKALAKNFQKKIFMDFVCFSNLRARHFAFFLRFFLFTFFLFFCMRYYNLRDPKKSIIHKMAVMQHENHICEENSMALSTKFGYHDGTQKYLGRKV